MNYVTNTFLLVSSSVRSKQLLCLVHGQGQKREQNHTTKNIVGFHNHFPLWTMQWLSAFNKASKIHVTWLTDNRGKILLFPVIYLFIFAAFRESREFLLNQSCGTLKCLTWRHFFLVASWLFRTTWCSFTTCLYNSGSNRARNFKSASRFALAQFWNYSHDYSLLYSTR